MFNGPGLDLSPTGRNPFLFTNISGVVLGHGGLPESLSTSTSEGLFDPGVLEAEVWEPAKLISRSFGLEGTYGDAYVLSTDVEAAGSSISCVVEVSINCVV